MRSSKSRSRNKSSRQRTLGNVVNRVFDSSGPEGKVRGTPQQIIEKYLALARDAQLSNDRVAEQSFFQHAEHYTRMLGEAQREMAERQGQNQHLRQDGDDQPRDGNGHGQQSGQNHGNGNGGRDYGNRDSHQPRDHGGNRDRAPRENTFDQPAVQNDDVQPVVAEAPVTRYAPPPPVEDVAEGLPAAVSPSEDDTSEAGPVDTPETDTKPARSRAPRARTPRQPGAGAGTGTGRARRKPAAEASDSAPSNPAEDNAG